MSYENEGWARFGKGAAGVLGVGAGLVALGFLGSEIESCGYQRAEIKLGTKHSNEKTKLKDNNYDLVRQLRDQEESLPKDVEARLAREGRLIPKDSCLRYKAGTEGTFNVEQIRSVGKDCADLDVRMFYNNGIKGVRSTLQGVRATINPSESYRLGNTGLQKRNKAQWVPYQRK
jgi:hypothetical protein